MRSGDSEYIQVSSHEPPIFLFFLSAVLFCRLFWFALWRRRQILTINRSIFRSELFLLLLLFAFLYVSIFDFILVHLTLGAPFCMCGWGWMYVFWSLFSFWTLRNIITSGYSACIRDGIIFLILRTECEWYAARTSNNDDTETGTATATRKMEVE